MDLNQMVFITTITVGIVWFIILIIKAGYNARR